MSSQEHGAATGQRSPFEAVPEAARDAAPERFGVRIVAIEFRGAKRLPEPVLRALISSRVGAVYDVETIQRDAQALRNTGRFSDVVWEVEQGRSGVIARFVLVERPLIEAIEYMGFDAVTVPEILERLEQRKIRLKVDALYDPDELSRARSAIEELLIEKGRKYLKVTALVVPVSAHFTVRIRFRAERFPLSWEFWAKVPREASYAAFN